jgi:hypothetical protein
MLNIKRLMCNPLQENCYVVSDDSREAVIIDCGAYYAGSTMLSTAISESSSSHPCDCWPPTDI